MASLYYYVQNEVTKEWERIINLDYSSPHHLLYSTELTISNSMGLRWTTTKDVLQHLLDNRSTRRLILRTIASAPPMRRRVIRLLHPLLTFPLYLSAYDTDKDFRQKIIKYMSDEEVAKWAI